VDILLCGKALSDSDIHALTDLLHPRTIHKLRALLLMSQSNLQVQ